LVNEMIFLIVCCLYAIGCYATVYIGARWYSKTPEDRREYDYDNLKDIVIAFWFVYAFYFLFYLIFKLTRRVVLSPIYLGRMIEKLAKSHRDKNVF